VAMPEHRRLRLAGGAAGEEQDGDLLGVGHHRLLRRGDRLELGQELVAGHDREPVDVAQPVGHGAVDDGEGRHDPLADRLELLVLQPVVEGHEGLVGEG
jgi:hypothetical protein